MNQADALAEVQHRVANDLMLVSRRLERARAECPLPVSASSQAIDDALAALLCLAAHYRQLYELPKGNERLCLGAHLERLANALRRAYLDRLEIRLYCRLTPVEVSPARARLIGIVMAELVGNAAKHAFIGDGGSILLTLSRSETCLTCEVRDDGRGLDTARFDPDARGLAGLGRIAGSLGGRLHVAGTDGAPGSSFALIVPV